MNQVKFKVDKLVRDKIGEQMSLKKIEFVEEILPDANFIKFLKNKLIEEAMEVSEETTKEGIIEELADVFEVIENLIKYYDIDMDEINKIKEAKKERNGGFDRRIYIPYVKVEKDNPEIKYFLNKANKYPILEEN